VAAELAREVVVAAPGPAAHPVARLRAERTRSEGAGRSGAER
jgi:hypothetical protein